MVMKVENTQVQMRKGILEFCILHIISRGEVYASDMLEELTSARIIVVEGTLYPLLTRLRKAGLVEHKWVESTSGPPRKYYGRKNPSRIKDTKKQFIHLVRGPRTSVRRWLHDENRSIFKERLKLVKHSDRNLRKALLGDSLDIYVGKGLKQNHASLILFLHRNTTCVSLWMKVPAAIYDSGQA